MKALIVIDLQNDFIEGGPLGVKGAQEIIPLINDLMGQFDCVVATEDWHPKNHISFASRFGKEPGEEIEIEDRKQILWPDHCVQGTKGADFPEALKREKIERVILKGCDLDVDSYSGFFDNAHARETDLKSYLVERGVDEIFIVGLALDYCVKYTAFDGAKAGFKTAVILKACRGIQDEMHEVLREMKESGVRIL